MARSRKNFPGSSEVPKGSLKSEFNGKVRSKTRQLLKDYINGKADEDDLDLLPDDAAEVSEGWSTPSDSKKYLKPKDDFLDEEEEEAYHKEIRKALRK